MSVRWDSLPPGARIASQWGGPPPPTVRARRTRELNRADLVRKGTAPSGMFVVYAPIPTTNVLLRMHPLKRFPIERAWRDEGARCGLPAIEGLVGFEVWPVAAARGGLGDAGSRTLAVKAIIDGMVEAGVLVDDDGRFVAWERYHAPVRGSSPLLRIELVSAT